VSSKGQAASKGATRKLLIVDDHPMMREGLVQLIGHEPGLAVCGEAGSCQDALEAVRKLKPDLVLADISLPDKSGLELIKDIQAVYPDLAVLVISMHEESLHAERVLRAGGRGYIMKQEGGKKILEAIHRVLDGHIYLSEGLSVRILEGLSGRPSAAGQSPVERFSDREFEVFQLIGEGKGTRAIAERLHLSIKTVETHRTKIKIKLEIEDAAELARYAVLWVETQKAG